MDRRKFLALTATGAAAAFPTVRAIAGAHAELPTIALLGATSRSGTEIIRQGLERGYKIKGFARTPSKVTVEHENLEMFQGDIRDLATIEAMLEGDEVVVSMVGRGPPDDPTQEVGEVDIYTVMGDNLITAMRNKGNKRLLMASSTGVEHRLPLDSDKPPPEDMSNMWRWNARYLYNDMYEMEKMIEESGLDYILLRPGFMVERPARNDLKFDTTGNTPGARVITYADWAAFILDNLTGDDYLNKAVGIYSDTMMNIQAEIDEYMAKKDKQ